MLNLLLIAAGGALGALARFATNIASQYLFKQTFPYGTLLVNTLGSFLAGFIMIFFLERLVGDYWRLFFMIGFLGAFTTFSSYSWETWVLYLDGQYILAASNIILNNVLALLMTFMGMHLGRWFGGLY